jgi:hypothetical protein
MQEMEQGRATVEQTAERLEAAVQADPRFGIDLDTMGLILSELPWRYAPLRRNSLRLYSTSFLTIPEMNNLGIVDGH